MGLRERTQEPSKHRHAQRRRGKVRKEPCRPETAGEEAAVLHAVPEQLQGQLGVLDVTVRQQQQVSDAPGRRQQAQGPQGPPQLGAAPYWSEALVGGREGGRRHGAAFKDVRIPQQNFHTVKKHKIAQRFCRNVRTRREDVFQTTENQQPQILLLLFSAAATGQLTGNGKRMGGKMLVFGRFPPFLLSSVQFFLKVYHKPEQLSSHF